MADLTALQAVLERELEHGCDNTSVEGGIDELIRTQARGEMPSSPLLRMVAHLPALGYRSLSTEERRSWARRAIATIVHARAEADAARLAPRATKKPATKRASGAVGAAATKTTAPRTPRAPAVSRSLVPPGPEALELPLRNAGIRLGPATFDRLERIGVKTIGDALRTYPYRHLDFSNSVPVSQVRVGVQQTVRGTVDSVQEIRMGRGGRMRSSEAWLSDDAGSRIQLLWFNQPYIARNLKAGTEIAVSGTPSVFRGRPTFNNPEFERLGGDGQGMHTGRMIPMYHLTEGLPQRRLRDTIASLVEKYADRVPDPLPAEVRERQHFISAVDAIKQIHYPDDQESLDAARKRLAFEELLAIQIGVVGRKRIWQEQGDAPHIDAREASEAFLATLPYALTGAQRRALNDVLQDISHGVPMARLVEGDVGSGKTVVALAAMLGTVADGYQAVMMAPTEVLADQHFRTICMLLSGEPEPPLNGLVMLPFLNEPLKIVLLTGSTRAKERREALDAIKTGGAQIVVGTHALIQSSVEFERLGLAVVDEQHRFGVMQRSALRDKGGTPHLMVMTATPIPRSLALTVYGDLDLSVIDEMPPGRTPIETEWLPPERRHQAFTHLRHEIEAGRQGFVIRPLVDGSDSVASRAASEEVERLKSDEFPDLAERIELLTGRMAARDKDAVMHRFADNTDAILVSTAVVEVGIDVPNATVMIISEKNSAGPTSCSRSCTSSAVGSGEASTPRCAICWRTIRRRRRRSGCRWWRARETGSRWRRPTSNCGGRGTPLARGSPGCPRCTWRPCSMRI